MLSIKNSLKFNIYIVWSNITFFNAIMSGPQFNDIKKCIQ